MVQTIAIDNWLWYCISRRGSSRGVYAACTRCTFFFLFCLLTTKEKKQHPIYWCLTALLAKCWNVMIKTEPISKHRDWRYSIFYGISIRKMSVQHKWWENVDTIFIQSCLFPPNSLEYLVYICVLEKVLYASEYGWLKKGAKRILPYFPFPEPTNHSIEKLRMRN